MSAPMEKAVENLDNVIERVTDESIKERLNHVKKIVSQNRKKIWLRTKSGKPIAEETLAFTEKLLKQVEDSTIAELEVQAYKIEEESRRRSMIVT